MASHAFLPFLPHKRMSDFDNHVYFSAHTGSGGRVFKVATGNANGPSSDAPVEINMLSFSNTGAGKEFYDGVVRPLRKKGSLIIGLVFVTTAKGGLLVY
jgi:hypothetical protein